MADETKPGAETPSAGESAAPKAPPPKKADPVMAVSPWTGPLVDGLKERFGGQIKEFSVYLGQDFLIAELPAVIPILDYLKAEQEFDYLVDITAVDYPKKAKRFEVVWILYSFAKNTRVRIKAEVAEDESPETAVGVHLAANWLEREVFDMFGIKFANHPNMTRILMPDEWKGYPLRKDYSIIQQDQDWVRENLKIESGQ
jgi:NADH-quinone oxidoreductase subunit C